VTVQEQLLYYEAAYWRREVSKHGRRWWNERKDNIRKKRGQAGLQALVDEMNRQKNEATKRNFENER
jgi:hypothetical protein